MGKPASNIKIDPDNVVGIVTDLVQYLDKHIEETDCEHCRKLLYKWFKPNEH